MKKKITSLLAMVLVLCMLLSGCMLDFAGYFRQMGMLLTGTGMTHFENMTYVRPDAQALQAKVDDCCGQVQLANNLDALVAIIYEAYGPLNDFSTAYALANIYYSKDLTDTYWAAEYAYCTENLAIAQAAMDKLYRALAKSPFRQQLETEEYFGAGFFDNYEGESVYDEVFTQLLSQEAELENRYYALWNEAGTMDPYSEAFLDTYAPQMGQLYVELIRVRQQMAKHLGYEDYPQMAYDFYYGRGYTTQQTTSYLADIRAELVPLYRNLSVEDLGLSMRYTSQQETLSYVRDMAHAMGGRVQEAFDYMEQYGLYDIAYGENKYDASFEVFIQNYYSPYVFINPTQTQQDKLTLAHEFGHFFCDYVNMGSAAGIDVAEVFSQGMEYLSLCYGSDTQELLKLKMVSSLSVMVEQAAYASFEQQVYGLEGEALTVENIQALFAQVGTAYGFDTWGFDSRSYVLVTHFFTEPMYVISYVVSNDVALQLYQLEKAESRPGAGLAAMEDIIYSAHSDIVEFTQAYGLQSPFADGRMTAIKETLQSVLG